MSVILKPYTVIVECTTRIQKRKSMHKVNVAASSVTDAKQKAKNYMTYAFFEYKENVGGIKIISVHLGFSTDAHYNTLGARRMIDKVGLYKRGIIK